MKEALKTTAVTCLAVAIWLAPAVAVGWKSIEIIDLWEARATLHKARSEYLFDGAADRGLLDICMNADGKAGVFYKEDCRP